MSSRLSHLMQSLSKRTLPTIPSLFSRLSSRDCWKPSCAYEWTPFPLSPTTLVPCKIWYNRALCRSTAMFVHLSLKLFSSSTTRMGTDFPTHSMLRKGKIGVTHRQQLLSPFHLKPLLFNTVQTHSLMFLSLMVSGTDGRMQIIVSAKIFSLRTKVEIICSTQKKKRRKLWNIYQSARK